MKKITLFLFALFSCWQINAQVNAYGFSQSTGTYTEISGGTVLGVSDNDDTNFNGIAIGFDFVYNDVTYTQVSVQSNGFLAFGATVFSSYNAISSGETNNVIAALNRDLQGNTGSGELSHQLSGTAPNRVLTVQWKNYRSYNATGDVYNFQIKLYETTNLVDVIYGAFTQNEINRTVQVGLRGATASAFNNRSTTTDWSATTAGVSNTASCTLTTIIKPSSGLTFTWTPPAPCVGEPVAGTVAPASQNACVGLIPADLILSGYTGGASGIAFQWETSTDGTTWSDATGATATSPVYDTPAYDGLAIVYYRCKVICTASTLFSYSDVVTVNPAISPTNQVTNLAFTNITYTGFTANWTNANGNRRVVYVSDAPIVDPINGNGPELVPATVYGGTGQQVVFDGTGTFVNVTGLNLTTQYYVKVIEYIRCGSAAPYDFFFNTSTDTNANTVTTSSPTALPWVEGFATTTTPANWVTTGWSLFPVSVDFTAGTSTNYLQRNIYSGSITGNFTTPIFEVLPANYRFVFRNKVRNWSGGGITPENSNEFVVSISTDNGGTYTIVETFANSGSGDWDLYTLNLAAFTGQSIRVRVTSNWIAGDYYVGFDDFKIEAIPTCTEPNSLNVSFVTNEGALLGWTEAATSTVWDVEWGVTGFVQGSGTLAPALTETSLSLADLDGNTSYSFYVRSVCAVGNESPWVGPFTFKTECDAVTEYFEDFQGVTAIYNGPIVDCFTKGGNGLVYLTTFGGVAPMAGNRLQMSANPLSTPEPTESYVSLKPVSNLSAGTHRLRFLVANSFGTDTFLELGYFENEVFTPIHQFDNITTSTQQYVYAPAALPLGTERLVFKFTNLSSPDAGSATIYIDNVYWEPSPTVVPACATNVVTTPNATCGNFATSFTWDTVPGADGYKLRLGTTPGGTEVLNNEIIGISTSYSFAGNFNTTYYYTVIPYNGFGDATGCTELSFATAVNGCYCTSLPTSNDDSGITNVLLGTTNFLTTDVTYFDHTATTVTLPQAINTNLQITFETGYSYNTYVWIDFNDNFTFETSEIVFTGESTNANPTVFNASFVMPAAATLGTHRMRIVTADALSTANPCYSGSWGVTLDFSVNIIPAPTCIPPLNLTATGITSSSASLGWTQSDAATVWDIEWGTAGFTPTGTPTILGTTTNPHVLSGLAPNTTYSFYVRANCGGAAGLSDWSGPFSFTTLCVPYTIPYFEGFESGYTHNTAVAGCNSQSSTTGTGVWTANDILIDYNRAPRTGSWNAFLQYGNEDWLFIPIELVSGTSYTVELYARQDGATAANSNMSISYGSSATAVAMTNEIVPATGIINGNYQQITGEFTPTTTGIYYVGIKGFMNGIPWYISLDDISINATLSTGTFDTANFKYYPNPVTDILTVSYSNVISEVVVYNLLGQQMLTAQPNATETQMDLSGLNAGTYLVKVTSDEVTKTVKVVKN